VLAEPAVEARESHFEHLARRGDGSVSVVVGRWCAEDGEDAVAALADESASLSKDRVDHSLKYSLSSSMTRWGAVDSPSELKRLRSMNLTPDVASPTQAEIVVGPLPDLVQHVLRDESREDAAQALAPRALGGAVREASADPCTKQHGIERLRQLVVRPDLDATDDARGVVDARDHHHRNIPATRGRR
jgi:hypothetical protein